MPAKKPTLKGLQEQIASLQADLDKANRRIRRWTNLVAKHKQVVSDLDFYRHLVENMNDVACAINLDGIITYCSPQFSRFGYDAGDITGRHFAELIHPDDVERAQQEFGLALHGETFPSHFRVRCNDGSFAEVEEFGRLFEHRGEAFFVTILRDVRERTLAEQKVVQLNTSLEGQVEHRTAELQALNRKLNRQIIERESAESALRESKERFRSLFRNAPIGIYRAAPDGRILMANPALIRMLGYNSFRDLMHRGLEHTFYTPAYARPEFQSRIELEGRIAGLESEWQRPDGTSLCVRETAMIVRDDQGNTLYFEGTIEDITEQKRAQAALDQAETRYRTLTEFARESIFIIDEDLRVRYVNAHAAGVTGRPVSELVGRPVREIFPQDAPQRMEHSLRHVIESGKPFSREGAATTTGGATLYLDTRLTPLPPGPDGKKLVMGIAFDVTPRRKAEDALRESEERYRAIYGAIPDPVCVYEPATCRFVAANDPFVQQYGYTHEELLASTIRILVPEEDLPGFDQLIRSNVADTKPVRSPLHRHRRKDGSTIWVDVIGAPIELNGKKLRLSIIRDVSDAVLDRRRIENQAMILANVSNPIIVVHYETGAVGYWNAGSEKTFGHSAKDVFGEKRMNIAELLPPDRNPDQLLQEMRTALQTTGEWGRNHLACRHKDGRTVWVDVWAKQIQIEPGRPNHILLVGRDVTSQTLLQERLIRAERLAAVGTLASGLAHEMNNLLGGLRGLADLAEHNPALLPRLLTTCRAVAERGGAFSNRMSSLAKADTSGQERPLDLNNIVATVVTMMEPAFAQRRIRVHQEYDDIPVASLNEGKILQVMLNLLGNACDSIGSNGSIHIRVSTHDHHILIAVTDTGAGISPEHMHRLFDPFFTTKTGDDRNQPSHLGLGLHESNEIIRSYGGSIEAQSTPGKGATFTIRLPIRTASPDRPAPPPPVMPDKAAAMLIADDDELIRFWLEDFLTTDGYTVRTATTGEHALRALSESHFDFAFVDLLMPGTADGTPTWQAIRKHSPDTRIIIITAVSSTHIPEDCRAAAHAVLKKPFGVADLAAAFSGKSSG